MLLHGERQNFTEKYPMHVPAPSQRGFLLGSIMRLWKEEARIENGEEETLNNTDLGFLKAFRNV